MGNLVITPIRSFSDNYIWCLKSGNDSTVAVVDPGDAAPVQRHLEENNLTLGCILITHHHSDHVGGIKALLQRYPGIPVYGPAKENIQNLTTVLGQGDVVELDSPACRFEVLDVPGHTAGHIAYFGEGVLFCGDTVFAGGCGRVFDGTFEQLADSMQQIAALPADTMLYCAHEYTAANLGFAKWVEPENQTLLERDRADLSRAEKGIPTVPSQLALELETNPFLRCGQPSVIDAAEKHKGDKLAGYREVFRELREWKDSEYD